MQARRWEAGNYLPISLLQNRAVNMEQKIMNKNV